MQSAPMPWFSWAPVTAYATLSPWKANGSAHVFLDQPAASDGSS